MLDRHISDWDKAAWMKALTVTIHLMHVLRWNSKNTALLNDFGVLAHYMLNLLQILHCDEWLDIGRVLPSDNLLLAQIHDTIHHTTTGSNGNHIRSASGTRCVIWICQPGYHLCLARLVECDRVEVVRAMFLADDSDRSVNLGGRKRIKGVWQWPCSGDLVGQLLKSVERHTEDIV